MSKGVVVIPLGKFTSEADHKLVADLATSVERKATVKHLRARAAHFRGVPLFGFAVRALLEEADAIEKGAHV